MTIDHRQNNIVAQMLQSNVTGLIANLARTAEELETAQARIKELEAKLKEASRQPAAASTETA